MDDRKSFLIHHFGLRGVAVFEAAKGVTALLLSVILLTVRHKDIQEIARQMLAAVHVNPDRRFYHDIMQAAGKVTSHGIWLFVFGVVVYAIVRFVEAGGLWREREWAEWFALLSGAMYLPWEIYELVRHANIWKWLVLLANIAIVLYLLGLRIEANRKRKRQRLSAAPDASPTPGS
jgi:uncharacterized membrane protein (DUF2068 family)